MTGSKAIRWQRFKKETNHQNLSQEDLSGYKPQNWQLPQKSQEGALPSSVYNLPKEHWEDLGFQKRQKRDGCLSGNLGLQTSQTRFCFYCSLVHRASSVLILGALGKIQLCMLIKPAVCKDKSEENPTHHNGKASERHHNNSIQD